MSWNTHNSEAPDGLDLTAELARRKERLAAIARAKIEQAEYEHKLSERKAKEQETGRTVSPRQGSGQPHR